MIDVYNSLVNHFLTTLQSTYPGIKITTDDVENLMDTIEFTEADAFNEESESLTDAIMNGIGYAESGVDEEEGIYPPTMEEIHDYYKGKISAIVRDDSVMQPLIAEFLASAAPEQARNNETYAKGFAYDAVTGNYKPFFSQYATDYAPHIQKTRQEQITIPGIEEEFDNNRAGEFKFEAKHFGEQPGFSAAGANLKDQEALIKYLLSTGLIKKIITEETNDPTVIVRTEGTEAPEHGLAGEWHKYLTHMKAYETGMSDDGKPISDDNSYVIDPTKIRDDDNKRMDRAINKLPDLPDFIDIVRDYKALKELRFGTKPPGKAIKALLDKYPELLKGDRIDLDKADTLYQSLSDKIVRDARKHAEFFGLDKTATVAQQSAAAADSIDKLSMLPITNMSKRSDKANDAVKSEFMSRARRGGISDMRLKDIIHRKI